MYSGEDSSGDPINSRNQFATWALGQTACSASEDNVDWAALAQQWIQMKESCSINIYNDNIDNNIPVAPPPPQISIGISSFKDYEEQGEAPMEVVKEDETFLQSTTSLSNTNTDCAIQFASNPPEWQSTWFQSQSQFCPTWNTWSNPNTMPVQIPASQIPVSSISSINLLNDVSHITPNLKISDMSSNEMPMDAAKRKTLPAWIREGLEKMEKEKLKQMEKTREMNKQDLIKDENEINTEKEIDEKKSLLVQDDNSEKSDYELETEINCNAQTINLGEVKQDYVEKTKEERIEELMLIVRKSLTELLLEVTNEEILSIAQEAFRKNKAKASSVQIFRKSSLSSITNKLGLGAYADSGSDGSDAETDKSEQEPEDFCDSEEELKESIRARHDAFKLIAQRIEASCMESEEREYRRKMDRKELISSSLSINGSSPKKSLIGNSSSGGGNNYENEYGEAHPDKKNISNGKRTKDRTSRFSCAKDSKYKTNIYSLPTSGTSATSIIASTSSMPPVASSDYDKRKSNKIPKQSLYLSDSSTSSNSSDSDRNYHRRSKSSRNRTRDREGERNKDKDKEREREKDKDNTGKGSSKHKEREKNSGRIKNRIRGKDRSNSKDKDRERSKDRDRERGRDRNSREKDKDRYRDRSKDHTREKDRIRDRSRDREDRDRHNKKFRNNQRRDGNRTNNSSDSDDYYHQSSRRRHRTKENDNRSRSNTPRFHSPHIRSSRSRSKSHY